MAAATSLRVSWSRRAASTRATVCGRIVSAGVIEAVADAFRMLSGRRLEHVEAEAIPPPVLMPHPPQPDAPGPAEPGEARAEAPGVRAPGPEPAVADEFLEAADR